jgi:hypothetical protein
MDWSGGACEWCDAEWEEIANKKPHPRWVALGKELEMKEKMKAWYRCSDCGSGCCDCS